MREICWIPLNPRDGNKCITCGGIADRHVFAHPWKDISTFETGKYCKPCFYGKYPEVEAQLRDIKPGFTLYTRTQSK